MRKKLSLTTLILMLIAVAAGGAFYWQTQRPITVQAAAPESNLAVRVFGLGTVEARTLARIGFEVGAAVVELNADHGDRVKRGDVLARLHSSEQEAKVAVARANAHSAAAALTKAEAARERARVLLTQKQSSNRRQKELAARSVVSEQAAEDAQRDADVAAADAAVADGDVAVMRMQMEAAQAQLQYEETLLDHHVLTAPFDAIVVERLHELGTVIRAGDPLFTLVAPETVWARAYVDEARAGHIEVGQPAEVRLRSRPDQILKAKVARIDIESDRVNEERRVYVKCEQCPPAFYLGEQVEIFVTVAVLDGAVLVPETEVRRFDGVTGEIWTAENGRLTRRVVEFGHRTEDARLEIKGGLPAGVQALIGVPATVRDGRAVSTTRATP